MAGHGSNGIHWLSPPQPGSRGVIRLAGAGADVIAPAFLLIWVCMSRAPGFWYTRTYIRPTSGPGRHMTRDTAWQNCDKLITASPLSHLAPAGMCRHERCVTRDMECHVSRVTRTPGPSLTCFQLSQVCLSITTTDCCSGLTYLFMIKCRLLLLTCLERNINNGYKYFCRMKYFWIDPKYFSARAWDGSKVAKPIIYNQIENNESWFWDNFSVSPDVNEDTSIYQYSNISFLIEL